jgi:hypothetical protein
VRAARFSRDVAAAAFVREAAQLLAEKGETEAEAEAEAEADERGDHAALYGLAGAEPENPSRDSRRARMRRLRDALAEALARLQDLTATARDADGAARGGALQVGANGVSAGGVGSGIGGHHAAMGGSGSGASASSSSGGGGGGGGAAQSAGSKRPHALLASSALEAPLLQGLGSPPTGAAAHSAGLPPLMALPHAGHAPFRDGSELEPAAKQRRVY